MLTDDTKPDVKTNVPVPLTEQEQAELARLRKLIKNPPDTSRVFRITPNMALVILDVFNWGNRPLKPSKISDYRNSMAAMDWALTGDTIKFSDADRLRDGQNRLTACWQAKVSFETHVVFGIPDAYFDRMDHGRNRDGSDLLAIAGYKNTVMLAAAVRWVHLIDQGRAKQRGVYPPREILRLITNDYPTLPDCVPAARQVHEATGQPPGIVCALAYQFNRRNAVLASSFIEAWVGGKWAGKFRPIGLMQEVVSRLQVAGTGRVHEVVRLAHVVTAWNLFVHGKRGRRTDFNWSLADDFPTIEG